MKRISSPDLREWADLILPWLPPRSLAAAAATCKTLRRAAASITSQRSLDASNGLEARPIPFHNPVDPQPYSYFHYTRFPLLPSDPYPSLRPWGGAVPIPPPSPPPPFAAAVDLDGIVSGCGCDDCGGEDCPCSSGSAGVGTMTECGAGCGCEAECGNRWTESGVSVALRIVKDTRKGWGLHAAEAIRRGEFVCEYAGEFLTTEEARRRHKRYDELASSGRFSPALLVVREHLPSGKACLRVNIDGTKIGNVARFINHSCGGGNLLLVLVRTWGSLLPRLCFFAAADIPDGEELTFSYGDATRRKEKGLPCFCRSDACVGILPSEDT